MTDGVEDEFGDAVDVEFPHEVAAAGVDSVGADAEEFGDVAGGFEFGDEGEELALARGEQVVGIGDALLPSSEWTPKMMTAALGCSAVRREEFAKADGQVLLPLVELITQARIAVDEVIKS